MKITIIATLVSFVGLSVALPAPEAPSAAPANARSLVARDLYCYDDQRCGDGNGRVVAQKLIDKDTQDCSVGGDWLLMEAYGDCRVWGRARNGGTSSYCRDVGYAIMNIATSCAAVGTTAGSENAGGNGNFELQLINGVPY